MQCWNALRCRYKTKPRLTCRSLLYSRSKVIRYWMGKRLQRMDGKAAKYLLLLAFCAFIFAQISLVNAHLNHDHPINVQTNCDICLVKDRVDVFAAFFPPKFVPVVSNSYKKLFLWFRIFEPHQPFVPPSRGPPAFKSQLP